MCDCFCCNNLFVFFFFCFLTQVQTIKQALVGGSSLLSIQYTFSPHAFTLEPRVCFQFHSQIVNSSGKCLAHFVRYFHSFGLCVNRNRAFKLRNLFAVFVSRRSFRFVSLRLFSSKTKSMIYLNISLNRDRNK